MVIKIAKKIQTKRGPFRYCSAEPSRSERVAICVTNLRLDTSKGDKKSPEWAHRRKIKANLGARRLCFRPNRKDLRVFFLQFSHYSAQEF